MIVCRLETRFLCKEPCSKGQIYVDQMVRHGAYDRVVKARNLSKRGLGENLQITQLDYVRSRSPGATAM